MLEEAERLILIIEHYVEGQSRNSWFSVVTQVPMEGRERRRALEDRCNNIESQVLLRIKH